MKRTTLNLLGGALTAAIVTSAAPNAAGAPISHIAIDGNFSDWTALPLYTDAASGELHMGTNTPDVHTTDPWDPAEPNSNPPATNHPNVDLREFRFTHDENNLYAYFRAAGTIGATGRRQTGTTQPQGRYYVIVTIDIDNNDDTGYWLHDGGYAPTSNGYDMNFELEFFDGSWNTGHYLSHDATTEAGEDQDIRDLTSNQWNGNYESGPYPPGFVQPAPGTYSNYTQWVYHANDTLTLVRDRGPVVPGIITMAISPDGHEIEICAPFKGFLKTASGAANMALGKTIDISFSLEASGELSPGREWGSDTGNPINGYFLGGQVPEPSSVWMVAMAGSLVTWRSRRASRHSEHYCKRAGHACCSFRRDGLHL